MKSGRPFPHVLRSPFFGGLALFVAAVAATLGISLLNVRDLDGLVNKGYADYRENILDQSASLGRLIFAVHRVSVFGPEKGESADAAAERRMETSRNVLSHAEYVRVADEGYIADLVEDDPLMLMPRLRASDREYRSRLSTLASLLASMEKAARPEDAASQFLAFRTASGGFMAFLEERSSLLLQLEDYFFVSSKKRLAHAIEHSRNIMLSISVLFAMLSVSGGFYLSFLMKAQAELAMHRNHLAELVAQRTSELTVTNDRLVSEIAERENIESLLRTAVREKESLLKEVYHRVKNNLTMVNGLISLQRRGCPPEFDPIFADLVNRIQVFSLIHEKLYRSADLANLELDDYLGEIARSLIASLTDGSGSYRVEVEMESFRLPPDSLIPLGLIVTEVITNSIKHAFRGRASGTICLRAVRYGEGMELSLSDDGTPPADPSAILSSDSLGALLIQSFCKQIGGTLELSVVGGTSYRLLFPHLRG